MERAIGVKGAIALNWQREKEVSVKMVFDRGHALVVGVDSYPNAPQFNVSLTAEDARGVAAVLRDRRYCCYPEGQVTLLSDETATRERILAELDRFNSLSENDTFLFFYSGHGAKSEQGDYYLTTHETRWNGNKVVEGSGIRDREFLERIQAIKAKRVFLIFNACHAGMVAPASLGENDDTSGQNLPDEAALALLGTGEGRVIITACRQNQMSYFDRNAVMTIFARVFVEGLQGEGVRDRKGYVSIFDLYKFVFNRVKAEVKKRWKGKIQEPELTVQKGIGAMAIALHQGKATEGSLGTEDRLESLTGKIKEVDPKDAKKALQQILSGEINLAAGGDIRKVEVVRGDRIDARQSKGFIHRSSGKISQHFGDVTTVNVGRDMYKSGSPFPNERISLREICDRLQQCIDEAKKRGDEELVEDLSPVLEYLRSALTAEEKGKGDRRKSKLKSAKKAFESILENHSELGDFSSLLQQVR